MGGAVTAVEFLFYCITVGEEVRHSRGSCRTAIDEDFVVELWCQRDGRRESGQLKCGFRWHQNVL